MTSSVEENIYINIRMKNPIPKIKEIHKSVWEKYNVNIIKNVDDVVEILNKIVTKRKKLRDISND